MHGLWDSPNGAGSFLSYRAWGRRQRRWHRQTGSRKASRGDRLEAEQSGDKNATAHRGMERESVPGSKSQQPRSRESDVAVYLHCVVCCCASYQYNIQLYTINVVCIYMQSDLRFYQDSPRLSNSAGCWPAWCSASWPVGPDILCARRLSVYH